MKSSKLGGAWARCKGHTEDVRGPSWPTGCSMPWAGVRDSGKVVQCKGVRLGLHCYSQAMTVCMDKLSPVPGSLGWKPSTPEVDNSLGVTDGRGNLRHGRLRRVATNP